MKSDGASTTVLIAAVRALSGSFRRQMHEPAALESRSDVRTTEGCTIDTYIHAINLRVSANEAKRKTDSHLCLGDLTLGRHFD